MILEPSADISPLQVEDSLLRLTGDCAQIAICNPTGFSSSVEAGTELGKASAVDLVEPEECPPEAPVDPSRPRSDPPVVNRITKEETKQRQQTLCELVGKPELLTPEQTEKLHQF